NHEPCLPGQRDRHDIRKRKALPFFPAGTPPHSPVRQYSIDVQHYGLQAGHAGTGLAPTRRSFLTIGYSRSNTRLTPSPIDCSIKRISRTRREIPFGSSEAAWSLPHIARSMVICRSTQQAPSTAAATLEGIPVSWPEYPTGRP